MSDNSFVRNMRTSGLAEKADWVNLLFSIIRKSASPHVSQEGGKDPFAESGQNQHMFTIRAGRCRIIADAVS